MKRTRIINLLINKIDAKSYLEIGIHNGVNFKAIKCDFKIGVDPSPRFDVATHRQTSDEFFEENHYVYDIIFIDGLHHADQVHKDIINALAVLKDGGIIICHDMHPTKEIIQRVPRETREWTGDCWKAWVRLRASNYDLEMFVVDTDYGVGVIKRGRQETININNIQLNWDNLQRNIEWLNLISVDDFLLKIK